MIGLLRAAPIAFGVPVTDRATWSRVADTEDGRALVRRAEALLRSPLPEGTDEVYLALHREYSAATRARWDALCRARRDRVVALTLAECVEDRGRFLAELEHTLRSLCAEKAWVFPNYDRELRDFKGTAISIDLFSSALAWNLASVDYALGARLPAEIRALLRRELERRIFAPFRRMIAGEQPRHWLNYHNNWNSVCLAGVTGTALALLEAPEERAFFVRAAMEQSWTFLRSYTEDGYCSEGVSYWNYGFGHYVLLAGIIHKATSGRIDLLARPSVPAAAAYAFRIEMAPGISPAFADTTPGARPDLRLMNFVNRRFGFGQPSLPVPDTDAKYLFADLFYRFDAASLRESARPVTPLEIGVRSWFPQGGVLVGRPEPGSPCRLAVALKGGHNAEQHNHNDVGSYVVLVGQRAVLLDPGQEVRTGRTFSARRYESKLLNSYGHPVPRVAETLQQPGAQARAVTLKTEFSELRDVWSVELRSAYPVPALESLVRTFVYDRTGAGSLTVSDEAVASSPLPFETALITLGTWQQTGPHSLRVEDEGESVEVDITANGAAVQIRGETVEPSRSGRKAVTRIGIRLVQPASRPLIRVQIRPGTNRGGESMKP
ncbi:MAG: hypothetical protein HZC55_16490 [Verrucomicrobia bacterium]|nr:hypothetical protein [Verrucomicrobiota bacterium]